LILVCWSNYISSDKNLFRQLSKHSGLSEICLFKPFNLARYITKCEPISGEIKYAPDVSILSKQFLSYYTTRGQWRGLNILNQNKWRKSRVPIRQWAIYMTFWWYQSMITLINTACESRQICKQKHSKFSSTQIHYIVLFKKIVEDSTLTETMRSKQPLHIVH